MGPFCVYCRTIMTCEKNGVAVAPVNAPYHQYLGDLWRCPTCKTEVVVGLVSPVQGAKLPDYIIDPIGPSVELI